MGDRREKSTLGDRHLAMPTYYSCQVTGGGWTVAPSNPKPEEETEEEGGHWVRYRYWHRHRHCWSKRAVGTCHLT
jgi:hypothetical protein